MLPVATQPWPRASGHVVGEAISAGTNCGALGRFGDKVRDKRGTKSRTSICLASDDLGTNDAGPGCSVENCVVVFGELDSERNGEVGDR